jgi:hypothetical protein
VNRDPYKHEQWRIAYAVLIVSQSSAAGCLAGALYGHYIFAPWLGDRELNLRFAQIDRFNAIVFGMLAGLVLGAAFSLFAWSILPQFRRLPR